MFRSSISLQAAVAGKQFGYRHAFCIPHPSKAFRGGEDAFFLHRAGLCVADGVGGWAEAGVNPAIYTRSLVNAVYKQLDMCPFALKPKDAIQTGIQASSNLQGSCTVIASFISPDQLTSTSHLVGDCGLLVVRDMAPVMRSKEQQTRFNCPHQVPSSSVDEGATYIEDLCFNDMYILGSDGLFDNVHDRSLLECIAQCTPKNGVYTEESVRNIAEKICELAFSQSKNRKFLSPFAEHAVEAGYSYTGGKQDDITVAVGVITPLSVDCPTDYSLIDSLTFPRGRPVVSK